MLRQDDSGYPPFAAEEVEASEVGDHRYRLESVPVFAFGLAKGDVVRVVHYDEALWVEELVEASGHSTVRIVGLVGGHTVDEPRREVEDLGCLAYPTVIDGMIAVDVPPSVDFDLLYACLERGRNDSKWDFSVGVRATSSDQL